MDYIKGGCGVIRLIDLSPEEARRYFLKGSSYFNADIPKYISFEPILENVASILNGGEFSGVKSSEPSKFSNVNYRLITNKDGKLDWRALELIHPVIYVSLINVICDEQNWKILQNCMTQFKTAAIQCYSGQIIPKEHQTDTGTQVNNWWQRVEQSSLEYSLEYSYLLHTDVINCYGSIYTHSIVWAVHGKEEAKTNRDRNLLGNKIDYHISSSRYGQTNGISQGSALMDFIAELVLGYVDLCSDPELKACDVKILRYRDDYRIFAHREECAEEALKILSDNLREVGMKLSVPKTLMCRNVIEGSIKPDKLASLELPDNNRINGDTTQKQLLRLHAFGRRHPNSGALQRMLCEFNEHIIKQDKPHGNIKVNVAIVTDIAFSSPATFSRVAAILSHMISLAPIGDKAPLWEKVRKKMNRVPNHGYLDIWLQRVIQGGKIDMNFTSPERICKIVNGTSSQLWESEWISCKKLKNAVDAKKIKKGDITDSDEVMSPKEIALFYRYMGPS